MVSDFEPGVFFDDWSPRPVGPQINVRKRNDDVEVTLSHSNTEGTIHDVLDCVDGPGVAYRRHSKGTVTIKFSKPTEVSSVVLRFKPGHGPRKVRLWCIRRGCSAAH